ncbi:glycosyltransferase (plasmid) [Skermanella sp. TT6]|uniref:Glycosyltransferase n=1 Tax=Skermanella cutis TaxID=2775420 RepID=A0ABX7BEF2_9PROT|nr:glycosyltransferase [Skermanella sp. TT6]QQP92767.1 glycosyltransferase [Skermanella sp. TT6]
MGMLKVALEHEGVEVGVIHRPQWRLTDVAEVLRAIKSQEPDVIHMQYPTHGFRAGLFPHLLIGLPKRLPTVVTLHDYIGQQRLRRLSMSAFSLASRIVLTADHEAEAFRRLHPWKAHQVTTIPIGSNIGGGIWCPGDQFTIIHFGMLRPGKGIEEMLTFARLVRQAGLDWRIVVVGAIVPHIAGYADTIMSMPGAEHIEWKLNQPAEEVGRLLRTSHVAYFPVPSGVHERRGSLLAAAANGVPLVARVGVDTRPEVTDHLVAAATPADAVDAIMSLREGDRLARQASVASRFSERFAWPYLAARYRDVFAKAMARNVRRRGFMEHSVKSGRMDESG